MQGETIQRQEKKYDLAGNQIEAIEHLYNGTQWREKIVRSWSYGPKGRLESLLEPGGKETRYRYDSIGCLEALIKPDGRAIYREYDDIGLLTHYFGEGIDYVYSYDVKNRLIKIDDSIHNTTLHCTYDIYDKLISEKLDSNIVIQRVFDPNGRRTALSLPDGSQIKYSYNGPFLHTIHRNGQTHTYSKRNLSGKPTEIRLANQNSINIEWDPLLRWKNYQAPCFSASYTYDTVGNLTQYNFNDPLGQENIHYLYDDLRQLTNEQDHDYTYDSLHNRTSKDGQSYTLNSQLQVVQDGQQEYTYDKNGNLLNDGIRSYEYDLLDRLIAVTSNGSRTSYSYDALNRRISKNNDLYI